MRKETEKKSHYILVGKPKGRKILGRPRQRWYDKTKWILHTCNVWTKPIWLRRRTYG